MTGKALAVGRAHTDKTAPFFVPVLFWVTGAVSILTGFWRLWAVRDLLLAEEIGQGPVIAAVHLFTLGGLTMLMMGALYQLTPVLLNCDPVPAKRSVSQWGIYTAGVAFFVTGLNGAGPAALWIGGSGIIVGLAFFLVNMFQRFRRRQTWNITAWFFAASLCYLGADGSDGGIAGAALHHGLAVICRRVAHPSGGRAGRLVWSVGGRSQLPSVGDVWAQAP